MIQKYSNLVNKIYETRAALRPSLIQSLIKTETGEADVKDIQSLYNWLCEFESSRTGQSVESIRQEFDWILSI